MTLRAGGRRQVAERIGGASFLSASDRRLHFGLGGAARSSGSRCAGRRGDWIDTRAWRWIARYRLREGQSEASPLPGWKR